MKDELKICLLMPKMFPRIGGFENVVYDLSRGLSCHHKVQVVFTSISSDRPLPQEVEVYPVLKEIKIRYIGFLLSLLYNSIFFFFYVWQERPDMVNVHPVFPGVMITWCSCKLLKIPLVATSHGGDIQFSPQKDYGTRSSPLANWILKKTLPLVDRHVLISKAMYPFARSAGSRDSRIEIIPNGVDPDSVSLDSERRRRLENELNIKRDDFVVLYLGRLIDLKRPQDLLYGFHQAKLDNAKLVFAGSGDKEIELKKMVHDLSLEDKVSFTGFITPETGKWDLINLSQVLVVPSLSEGFNLTVLEAYASSKPVIGTRIGALEELINPGKTGLLVDTCSPDGIKEALTYMYQHPEKREKMGLVGQELFLAKYTRDKMVQKYQKLYLSLINKK
ncbi:MAG: glycosyltransferase family 4 protein [Euryarchaeota archaeon]|nr:glycosyltransferase family 4 protein [Euryarchaeota archaeon]